MKSTAKYDIGDSVNLPLAISDWPEGLIVAREYRPSDMRLTPRGGWVYAIQEIRGGSSGVDVEVGGTFEVIESEISEWSQSRNGEILKAES